MPADHDLQSPHRDVALAAPDQKPEVPRRTIRISDAEWGAAQAATEANNDTITAVIRRALAAYAMNRVADVPSYRIEYRATAKEPIAGAPQIISGLVGDIDEIRSVYKPNSWILEERDVSAYRPIPTSSGPAHTPKRAPDPLAAPISFHDITFPAAGSDGLRLRIGDIHDNRNRRSIPYVILPRGQGANIRVVGDRGTGKSTTLQTIVASAAKTYSPTQVQFYLIGSSTKLSDMKNYPNVGAYGSSDDTEFIDRIIAEFERILAVRDVEFERRGVTSFSDYTDSKVATPVPNDHYGEVFLVIDDVETVLGTRPDGVGATAVERRLQALTNIASAGKERGMHLIVAGKTERGLVRFFGEFGLWIVHRHETSDPLIGVLNREARQAVTSISADEPGRAVEPTTGMSARICVPQLEEIEPLHGSEPERYDSTTNYSNGIRALGDALAAEHNDRAPRIERVPSQLPWTELWPLYQHERENAAPRALPIGVAADDLTLVTLPADDPRAQSHLVIAGDPGCGKTAMVRTLLRGIIEQYSPDEAQIYLFDATYSLTAESEQLAASGHLARYENTTERINAACVDIAAIVADRQPDTHSIDPKQISRGNWYTGPKIFVFIDPASALTANSMWDSAPTDPLTAAIDAQREIGISMGLQVFATEFADQYLGRRTGSALYKALTAANSQILMLSGASPEPIQSAPVARADRITFKIRRPGLGQLYSPSTGQHPIVQTAWQTPSPTPEPDLVPATVPAAKKAPRKTSRTRRGF